MAQAASPRTRAARELFAPLGPTYDRYARLLSLGQDPRWRRFLVERIEAGPADLVLDVATGTGAVAIELVRRTGCSVVGVDPSTEMLEEARRRIKLARTTRDIRLVEGRAEELPFDDGIFDALTVTYLLRYVDDPGATLVELARVVRSGGTVASLEFGLPPRRFRARPGSCTRASGSRLQGSPSGRAGTRWEGSCAAASATSTRDCRSTGSWPSGGRRESRTSAYAG